MILIIILDTDHDFNLSLGLNSWIQIVVLNLALQASFVHPFPSLIKFILVKLKTNFYLLNSDLFHLSSACSSLSLCCSLGWTNGRRHSFLFEHKFCLHLFWLGFDSLSGQYVTKIFNFMGTE
jgi:hypothetical protein